MDISTISLIAGIVILSASLIFRTRKHYQREAKRAAERRAAVQAVREAEIKRQATTGETPKSNAGSSRTGSERIPLPAPVDPVFSGGSVPRNIAQWETEMHQLGRQIIGQIDSKAVVLQTLTLEANRAANRLEIMIDHLETLLKNGVLAKKTAEPSEEPAATEPTIESPPTTVSEPSNLLPAFTEIPPTTPFTSVLDELQTELDSELEQFHQRIDEQARPATILKAEPKQPTPPASKTSLLSESSVRLPASFSLSAANPLRSEPLPTPSSPTPSALDSPHRISPPTSSDERSGSATIPFPSQESALQQGGLSFTSLFDDELADRQGEEVFAVAGPGGRGFGTSTKENVPQYKTPILEQSPRSRSAVASAPESRFTTELGSRLELRKQVEMLADYGYSARQIAQDLNITVGEVELMLNLRG